MPRIEKTLAQMRRSAKNVRFSDLCGVCDYYFGQSRQSGSSHVVYRMPWQGDPRVNIQNDNGMAKPYQVKQVLKAIARLQNENIT
jgi:hypothetical protein